MHWSEAIARDIIAKRKEERHVVATGITPSGAIHVGNLREIIVADAVHTALLELGVDARLIYVADSFDPLRRRYPFLPPEFEAHVGKPLSEIPDPEGCHATYADHYLQPFLDSLTQLGIQIEVFKADELYKSGRYTATIKEALAKKAGLARIIEEVSGRQLPADWSPFNPLCPLCGRINAAVVTKVDPAREEVAYACKCGHQGVASFQGGGKLGWRVDWAARWKILSVTIEPFGKDHASPGGSFDTGRHLATEIFEYLAPYPIPFEHILLKLDEEGAGAKVTTKMSSSRGTNVPVHEILRAVPPEILKHVLARVWPEKHIEFNPSLPLLNLIDEYERQVAPIGRGSAGEISFRHLVTLVQIARYDFSELLTVIRRSGFTVRESNAEEVAEFQKKAQFVVNWLRTYAPQSVKFELQLTVPVEALSTLSAPQRAALGLLARELEAGVNLTAEAWHNKIYAIAATLGIEPKEVFEALYRALLKKPSGPRAGWLLASLEPNFLKERLEVAEKL